MTEREIQKECEKFLKKHNILYIHKENNRHQQYSRSSANKQYKGFPDLAIYLPHGKTVFVELKTQTGKVTPEQEETIQQLLESGYHATICRSVEEFIKFIEEKMHQLGYMLYV